MKKAFYFCQTLGLLVTVSFHHTLAQEDAFNRILSEHEYALDEASEDGNEFSFPEEEWEESSPTKTLSEPPEIPLAKQQQLSALVSDVVLGNSQAPLEIIMYFSLTCTHCKEFEEKIFPEIKKKFIDTNKIKFVFRDFPVDYASIKAAQVAWCGGKENYLRLTKAIFDNYNTWTSAKENWQSALKNIATQQGLPLSECQACLDNKALETAILNVRLQAHKIYKLDHAPAFVINGQLYPNIIDVQTIENFLKNLPSPDR